MTGSEGKKLSFWELFVIGGGASVIAEALTMPLDTVKVRLQVQQHRYKSLTSAGRSVLAEEGVLAFWQGLSPAILRQVFFASFRLSIFDWAMQRAAERRGSEHNVKPYERVFWSAVSGAVGITIANPFDVLKVRFQNAIRSGSGTKPSILGEAQFVYQAKGVMGFYQSLPPNLLRSVIMNVVELSTYSQSRSFFVSRGILSDGNMLYFVSSALAGLMAVAFASPFDVLKSRMMAGYEVNGKKMLYSSIFAGMTSLYREKGFLGFYAGVNASFHRILWWNVSMFMMKESITNAYVKRKSQH